MTKYNPKYFERFKEGVEVDKNSQDNTPVDRTSERFRLWCGMDAFFINTNSIPSVDAVGEHVQAMGYVSDVDPEEEQVLWLFYHTELGHFHEVPSEPKPEFEAGPIGEL